MKPTYCAHCGTVRGPADWCCSACHETQWADYLSAAALEHLALPDPEASKVYGFLAGKLFLPPGDVVLIAGPRGVGKTTLALELFDQAWFVPTEMGPEGVAAYVRRIGARLAGVGSWEVQRDAAGDELVVFPAAPAADLVVDSATATRRELAVYEAARAHAREHRVRVALIAHYTKDGEILGSSTVGHMVDAIVRLERDGAGGRKVVIDKQRAGPEGTWRYAMTGEGVRAPAFRGFYSVEGRGPQYELVMHPDPRARHAAVYRAAERSAELREQLPPPPCAVSALQSDLYDGGWVEPPDGDERRAFAESLGLTYWSPT